MKRLIEQAGSFKLYSCGDRRCGVHLIPLTDEGEPICDVVLNVEIIEDVVEKLKDVLYAKAAMRDEKPWSGSGRAGNGSDM